MQPIEFIILGILYVGAGLLAVFYYQSVPAVEVLKKRLPNRPSGVAVVLALFIGAALWYIFSHSIGLRRIKDLFELVFALLFFESLFLLYMRWLKSNGSAALLSAVVTGIIFWLFFTFPSFVLQNSIIIVAILGASTLLIRIGMLKTWYLFALTAAWVPYDIYLTQRVLPRVTAVTTDPYPTLLFPAVTVGALSLGSGDFMFLSLFTLVLLREFGPLPAIVHVAAQGVALLVIGLLVQTGDFIIPMLTVIAPIYLLMYVILYIDRRRHMQNAINTGK